MKSVRRVTPSRCTVVTRGVDNWFTPFAEQLVEELSPTADATLLFCHEDVEKSDIVFYLSYHSVVPQAILALGGNNVVVHASDLPHGRGWSPLTWQVLEGREEITLTLFEATDSVDAGPIYIQKNLELSGTELIEELREVIGIQTISICAQFVTQFSQMVNNSHEQVGLATYYRRRTPDDSRIDPSRSIEEQFNLLRVVDNDRYPAFFELNNRRYYLRIESSGV
jgi:methionyl-tRNA formyltransferase